MSLHLETPASPAPAIVYSVEELAGMLKLSRDTIRRAFANEPGTLRIQHPRVRSKSRPYVTLRIPHSVLEAWLERHRVSGSKKVEAGRGRL